MGKPRIAGATVIVAGTLLALGFRLSPTENKAEEPSREQHASEPPVKSKSAATVPDPQPQQRLDVSHVSQNGHIEEPRVAPPMPQVKPPRIAQNYEPALAFPEKPQGPPIPVPAPPVAKEHVIRNGDSLSSLATKYYGRHDFARYIFQHNQDKLRHPDLLPLGATLKIPPQPTNVPEYPQRTGSQVTGSQATRPRVVGSQVMGSQVMAPRQSYLPATTQLSPVAPVGSPDGFTQPVPQPVPQPSVYSQPAGAPGPPPFDAMNQASPPRFLTPTHVPPM